MHKFCPHCKETIQIDNWRQFCAHLINCKCNPKLEEIRNRAVSNKKNRKKLFNFFCKKCGNKYTVFTTQYKIDINKYKKHCSRYCACSKPMSNATKAKISAAHRKKFNAKEYFIKKICPYCKREFFIKYYKKQECCSVSCAAKYKVLNPEFRKKLSMRLTGRTGGMRNMGGYGRVGYYKGNLFQSSWELAFMAYHFENKIEFKRNTEYFFYYYNEKKSKYYPDFVKEGNYVELKGFHSTKTDAKVAQFPKDKKLNVLYKKDMKQYIDYCKNKYGINFVDILKDKKNESEMLPVACQISNLNDGVQLSTDSQKINMNTPQ